MTPFVGMIAIFSFNYAPRQWALCNGQLLSISQYQALFSLLGTTYGGDGRSTFGLPDLRGRTPLGQGQGIGLSYYTLGEANGSTAASLTSGQMPAHTHIIMATTDAGTTASPEGAYLADTGNYDKEYKVAPSANAKKLMHPATMSNAGGSQPVNRLQPYITVNFCIALEGIFPPRN